MRTERSRPGFLSPEMKRPTLPLPVLTRSSMWVCVHPFSSISCPRSIPAWLGVGSFLRGFRLRPTGRSILPTARICQVAETRRGASPMIDACSAAGSVVAVDTRSSFGQRLREAIEASGKKAYIIEKAAGVGKGHTSKLMSGKRGKQPSEDLVRRLSQALGVRQEWLGSGEGPMRPTPATDPPYLRNRPEWPEALAEALERYPTIPAQFFYDLGDSIVPRAPAKLDWQVLGGLAREIWEWSIRADRENAPASVRLAVVHTKKDHAG